MSVLGEPAILANLVDPVGIVDQKGVAGDVIVPMWRQRLRIFMHNKLAIASVGYLVLILLFCYLGPVFYHTNQTNQALALDAVWNAHPSAAHLLGTDSSGFDELGRIMYGGEYSLTLGMLAGLITIIVGTIYGMVSGFIGGVVDTVMMRILDAFLSIPYLFLLISLFTIFSRSTTFLIIIIGITGWWANARIIRGDALLIKKLEYTQAATSMGASKWHIIRRHVFPNSISNIVTVATFSVADAILFLSALGFLGLGILTPQTDWGTMLQNGTAQISNGYWWEIYPLATVFILVVVAINYIGDALRDTFEVRLIER
ncbi:MAG TPA: ABC transporter permease [Acidimicrobiales bacterium]|jgi:peptide/nickel transport system permease protein|nr:ABC transporter permease [Acidimicrobiales bacterium]